MRQGLVSEGLWAWPPQSLRWHLALASIPTVRAARYLWTAGAGGRAGGLSTQQPTLAPTRAQGALAALRVLRPHRGGSQPRWQLPMSQMRHCLPMAAGVQRDGLCSTARQT